MKEPGLPSKANNYQSKAVLKGRGFKPIFPIEQEVPHSAIVGRQGRDSKVPGNLSGFSPS
ncbi:MAG: hypothetical protein HC789_10775 [Microcoleus sp. CSU_2_2]|nr:hypothetical protein [Microcoleus sp. SU_5_3]NJS10808.1 hypothetical protein [Microcoleus sp. CSU_2_2]